jgi:hypothetical protein
MELTDQNVNADTSKMSAIVIKLKDIFLIMATLSGWIIFMFVQELAQFLKSKGTDCAATLFTNRRNIPTIHPFIKDKRLESAFRGGRSICLAGGKRVTMILKYHEDEICFKVNKAHMEETKPVIVYNYKRDMRSWRYDATALFT